MFDKWVKERPIQGMIGYGGGAASRSTIGGSTPIEATGGTTSTPGDGYKYLSLIHI